ncbi:MAG: SgcJ/EcaC family oxidoreductase [Gammaproteobacteria bacterium]
MEENKEETKLFSTSEEAEIAFYAAFQQEDLELMMSVWANDEDITCIHPGGNRLDGLKNIVESWEQMFSHENGIKFEINKKRVQIEGDIAIHHVIESIYLDGELQSEIIATNIYRKTEDSWRLVLHHASPELRPALIPSDEDILDEQEEEKKIFH